MNNRSGILRRSSAFKATAAAAALPGPYEGFGPKGLEADRLLGFDKFARNALETYKDGAWVSMPTNNWREMRDFFSEKNYVFLQQEIEKQSGFPVHLQTLWETMLFTFYQIKPRSDSMDRRILLTDQATVDSYVQEMNKIVVHKMVVETKAAQKHRVEFMKRRANIRSYPDTPVDTRSRLVGSMYSLDYMLR